jgi:hypothetical protein
MTNFVDFVTSTQVVDEIFGSREIGVCYYLSMMTQKDEIENDKHLKMGLAEFKEAISRVAEKANLPPPSELKESEGINYNLHKDLIDEDAS